MRWWIFLIVAGIALVLVLAVLLVVLKKHRAKDTDKIKKEQADKPYNNMEAAEDTAVRIILCLQFDGRTIEEKEALVNGSIIVGRSDMCDVYINNSAVSRQHFAIEYDGESFYVQDLETTNGTMLNDAMLTHKRRLEQNDKISIDCLDIVVRW